MFSKLLIANRGEIACRIIRTARDMGIATVAVYSEADAGALAVRMADEAVAIGPAPAAESYLVIDNIIAAARETGADAVHPGFGFLAENADFAEALAAAGIAFVGPPPAAIRAMGDKITSKRIAADAGVATVPGHADAIADADAAVAIAETIGYPVVIKATAGGGGKGMRIATDAGAIADGFRSARNEARASFGDDRVFIEKFISQPRHIEIQVLADGHGNVIHLGERECSIQRRHQKVIEEAPSPAVDDALRATMGAQAVALARAVDYCSAGTIEFIVDQEGHFYFLEMNTRLQVEHPVTEAITGLDLVEQMIRIADGETLPLDQDAVRFDGWAVEARIYAEDPARDFLPAIGRLVRFAAPGADNGAKSVRVDTGVAEGSDISIYYDPMIAKLVTHGPDRTSAVDRMADALDRFYVRGVAHNMSFLAAVMAHPRFRAGRLATGFIDVEFPDGYAASAPDGMLRDRLVAVAAIVHSSEAARARRISGAASAAPVRDWVVRLAGDGYAVRIVEVERGWQVTLDGRTVAVDGTWRIATPLFRATIDGAAVTVQVDRAGIGYRLVHGGADVEVRVLSARAAELDARMPAKPPPDLGRFLLSPMPGLLVSLAVAVGQQVKVGDELAVVEAMKMENILRAAVDAVVASVHAAPGDSLSVDQAILEFE